jgi:SAM-dependent methyltransferase
LIFQYDLIKLRINYLLNKKFLKGYGLGVKQKIMNIKKISIGALTNLRYHNLGRCNICGNLTVFVCTDVKTARGNFLCPVCRSFSRKRHIAKIINDFYGSSSISEIPKNLKNNMQLHSFDINDSFYKYLNNNEFFSCSEFLMDVPNGTEIKNGVYCQDIENLTFNNETFDIIVTEDVLEHVRDYEKSFKEILRVLKPGGYHIFTIPFYFDRDTLIRVDTSGNKDIPLLTPEYHESKFSKKVLAYRTFGNDLFDYLHQIGFNTKVDFSKLSYLNLGIYDSYVFISRKMV